MGFKPRRPLRVNAVLTTPDVVDSSGVMPEVSALMRRMRTVGMPAIIIDLRANKICLFLELDDDK